MNLVFNPSILALTLSAAVICRAHQKDGDKIIMNTDGVPFYSRHHDKKEMSHKKPTAQRPVAEKIIFPPVHHNRKKRILDQETLEGAYSNPDVGILLFQGSSKQRRRQSGGSRVEENNDWRILQTTSNTSDSEAEAYPVCGLTCKPSACNCVYNFWSSEECTTEINALCNGVTDENGIEWTIQGCIPYYSQYPFSQAYLMNLLCPFSKCVVNGGTLGSCRCQMFKTNCEKFGDEGFYMPVSHNVTKILLLSYYFVN